ncbi:condensation domain-containing protein, partial [Dactylosporangium darangshiense]|uniref:condensation domain-containing protein n=1 Tax=Dactylosporangium darangshiense TaxID=579108 RepID=UPI0031EA463C
LTPTQELLTNIWTELLHHHHITTTDDFFDLGGHSLLATQVISRIRSMLGIDLATATMFDHPTIAELAIVIDAATGPAAPPITPADRDLPLPLSYAQQRLWFLQQLDPDTVEYHVSTVIPLADPIDPAAVTTALTAVVARHEILRTRLVAGSDGVAYQVIDSPAPVPLEVLETATADDARMLLARQAQTPFDLAAGPLLRATLVRPAEGGSQLVLTMHHVITDAWSADILRRELTALLTGASLPELPIQYADYAVWQRQWLAGPVLDAQLGYWRTQLADPPVLELPTDRPRPAVRSAAGGLVEFTIPADVTTRLRELSRQHGTTMFMTLTAAYALFLARHTGQDDILIGTPVAGRGRAETEGLIGFFVNTLVLRTQLDDDPTFAELLARTRTTALNGYAHQDLPFEQLVDELVHHRDRSRTPLIDTVFTYATTGGDGGGWAPEGSSAKWDLTLTVLDAGGETLTAALQYSTALFDHATVTDWAARFSVLLAGAAADVDAPVSQLPVLDAAQRAWLAECNDAGMSVAPSSIVEVFEAQAAGQPDAVAVVDGPHNLTYAQLNTAANRVAWSLLEAGTGPGTVVAVRIPCSADLVIAMLGVLKTGAAYLPIDVHHPDGRIDTLLHDAAPHVVLTEVDVPAGVRDDNPGRRVDPGLPAYVIYTSGSTGTPKGVIVGHRSVTALIAATTGRYGFGPDDVWTLFHSPAFDFAVWELWGALLTGGRVVIVGHDQARDPAAFTALLAEQQVTVLNQTPSAFRHLGPLPPTVRLVIFGGEALTYQPDPQPAVEFVNMFGITE